VSEEDFYREASAKAFGVQTVRWKEYPFEWLRDKNYAVLRLFENGSFTRFYGGVEFAPGKTGCTIRVFADINPGIVWELWLPQLLVPKAFRTHSDIAMNISNSLQ
jgi:hypothetical protein